MTHDKQPKILIVAENASSRFGGEAFLPLKYFSLLHKAGHSVRLIAHSRNRADLSDVLGDAIANVSFVEDSVWHRTLWRIGSLLPKRIRESVIGTLMGLLNQHYQARIIRRHVRDGEVDLIHQPIPVSPRAPSSIHGFGVPVVIGPMNGGMMYPTGYEYLESRASRLTVRFGRRLAVLANILIPGKRRASVLLVANERTRAALPMRDHPRIMMLVENGVDLAIWQAPPSPDRAADGAFRLVFMGRLISLKAVDITLQALRQVRSAGRDVQLDILGDGPERTALEAQNRDLGAAVRFHGFQPQDFCARIVAASDALILNSVHECGGAVVLEAMSLAKPVIVADWGGPADYVDPNCGILVDPVPREGFADRLADAILRLADDPALCHQLGAAGAQKVREHFDWDRKIVQMLDVYDIALKAGPTQH